jgi:tetratricopeptide (TPR) repeat protein
LAILAHEVGHELIRRRMPGAPRWYQEGLAGYLESVEALDDRTVRFRYVHYVRSSSSGFSGTLEDDAPMLSLDATVGRHWETATDAQVGALYFWGRAWVALLRAEQPARVQALDAALAAGTSWQQAWTKLRAQLDVAYLQEKLWRSLHGGGLPREVHEITPLDPAALQPLSEREMASWEIHLCLADLWVMAARTKGGSNSARNVRTELEAAAREAPGEVLPQVRLADLERDPAKRRARAEELVALFPGSPAALVFRARVLGEEGGPPEERRAAALAAVTAAPDSVDALTAHAIEELRAANPESALVTISHAVELEPWNSQVFVVRALVLGAIGRCDEAAAEAQRAIDVLPDDPVYGDLRALIDERDRIDKACTPSSRP